MHISLRKALFLAFAASAAFLLAAGGPVGASAAADSSKPAESAAIHEKMAVHHPVFAAHGMVATSNALASQVGLDILKRGGNAVDAAVAVGFTMAVTYPRAGNIGGGGFMMIHDAAKNETVALDYREKAPKRAWREMYQDKDGNVIKDKSRFHGFAVGVPGTVAGLLKALEEHGTMNRQEVMAPAIRLAVDGFTVSPGMAASLRDMSSRLRKWPSTVKVFFKPGGQPYKAGDTFKQPDLAHSLKLIAEKGEAGFYEGETAGKFVKAVKEAGGLMSLDDLKNYRAIDRKPVMGTYRDYEIVSMPPPSSGGTHIIQILNMLEHYPLRTYGPSSAMNIHFMAEAMKLAYADRSEYMGDSDFVDVPVKALTSKDYAARLVKGISPYKARPADDIKPGKIMPYESDQTTHFSIADGQGNAVANTYTLNFSYGTGLVVDGAGFLLNNEMDDFSAKPGVPNAYGLIGGDANAVEPEKRPLSSMSPTFVFKDGKPFVVTGSPGGSRIITTVLQIVSNVIDHDMNIAEAVNAPRIHDQWRPDEIRVESTLNGDTIRLLEAMGHKVNVKKAMGAANSIMIRPEGFYGAADPRRTDSSVIGY